MDDRRSYSVWLKAKHRDMLDAIPDVGLGDIVRRAIEELFEGRNDREYARICIEEDVKELEAKWERYLGLTTQSTVTATEEGFRVVMVPLKDFTGATPPPLPKVEATIPKHSPAPLSPDVLEVLDDSLDAWDEDD